MTDAWWGCNSIGQLKYGIYDHVPIVHSNEYIDAIQGEIDTETIEGLGIQVTHIFVGVWMVQLSQTMRY